jgi:hypothetical protein
LNSPAPDTAAVHYIHYWQPCQCLEGCLGALACTFTNSKNISALMCNKTNTLCWVNFQIKNTSLKVLSKSWQFTSLKADSIKAVRNTSSRVLSVSQ